MPFYCNTKLKERNKNFNANPHFINDIQKLLKDKGGPTTRDWALGRTQGFVQNNKITFENIEKFPRPSSSPVLHWARLVVSS